MNNRILIPLVILALAVSVMLFLAACGGDDEGLSRAKVAEIMRGEMAESPPLPTTEPGLTYVDVEESIRAALADMLPDTGRRNSK